MKNTRYAPWFLGLAAAGLVACGGGSTDAPTEAEIQEAQKQATSEIEKAFEEAPSQMRQTAQQASQAMQAQEYEKALDAQQQLLEQPNITFEQGVAIKQSQRALRLDLMRRAAAGDKQAQAALDRLKRTLP